MYIGIDSHYAEHEGEGNSTYTRNLIAALFAMEGPEAFALFAAEPGHPFYRSLPPRRDSQVFRGAQGTGLARLGWTLGRAAARQRVDGLHVQYWAPLAYRGRLVVTVHDLAFLHLPETFPAALRLALRVLVPRSIAKASRVITVSEFSRADIVSSYGVRPEKVTVIPEGAGANFRPLESARTEGVLARYGLRPGFLFSLGRLNRRKNLERILLAYGRLRTGGVSDAPLVIGGKRDYGGEEVLRRIGLSEVGSSIRWIGLIPDEDLPAFYSAAACFVYPSLFEGFGLPVLEAMACGTPVVTSDRGALAELVGDAAMVVDPTSVEALADAMTRVLTDAPLAADLGRRGFERSRRFSWRETARRTLEVYREAVGR
jgi:glycosyltransferase involved in cell wall biosynthesis